MSVERLIDANANRAREGLRVMEDTARFVLDDASLTAALKQLRHDLVHTLDQFDPALSGHRDTPGDVGISISTASERTRSGIGDVIMAAGRRAGEAMRCIEEYAKTIDATTATLIESLRYRTYDLHGQLLNAVPAAVARRGPQWRVCVLLTMDLCRRPWEDVVIASINGGADCIQVREKDLADDALLAHVRRVGSLARASGTVVVVNDRVDIAMAANADGVHLGTGDVPIADARRIAGENMLIGASTHDLNEARAALAAGADYCGVGAMFDTTLKPDRTPSGVAYLKEFIAAHPDVPHLAIGGITPDNVAELYEAGCQGIAVSTAVCGSAHPEMVVEAMASGHGKSPVSTADSA